MIKKILFQILLSRSLLSLTGLDIGSLELDDSHFQAPLEERSIRTCLNSSSQNERNISGMNKKLIQAESSLTALDHALKKHILFH